MKELDSCSFYNDKELFTSWFMDEGLEADTVNHCRALMDEMIFGLNWRTSMGVTLEWKYAKEHLEGTHIVKDYGKYKSVFLDFMESRLPKGLENKPANYSVIVYNTSAGKVFALPHKAIVSYWTAGWPRAGWHPGRYVIEPWELLKPIHDFLEGFISYNALYKATQYKKYRSYQYVFRYVYETVYPLIHSKRYMTVDALKVWVSVLREQYDMAVGINKVQFKDLYNPRNRFTGPSERSFSFEWFDDPERMKNPFLVYYKKIREEYLEKKAQENSSNQQ